MSDPVKLSAAAARALLANKAGAITDSLIPTIINLCQEFRGKVVCKATGFLTAKFQKRLKHLEERETRIGIHDTLTPKVRRNGFFRLRLVVCEDLLIEGCFSQVHPRHFYLERVHEVALLDVEGRVKEDQMIYVPAPRYTEEQVKAIAATRDRLKEALEQADKLHAQLQFQ